MIARKKRVRRTLRRRKKQAQKARVKRLEDMTRIIGLAMNSYWELIDTRQVISKPKIPGGRYMIRQWTVTTIGAIGGSILIQGTIEEVEAFCSKYWNLKAFM